VSRQKFIAVSLLSLLTPVAWAQSFQPGNLIFSRTVYVGNASTVTIGQALPGGGHAIADGSFPNVFRNETVDPSFGVTSPIFIDQLTTAGSLVNTRAIDARLITSSFASKSELAINVSTDRSSIPFVGYAAPSNTLGVSNSNTAAVFDPTNPVSSKYARAIGQINLATGAWQVTDINGYSGNNGRAAVLANGNYYLVGNAGNGSGNGTTLSQLSDNTGVQRIAAGASGNTTAVGAVQGTFGSATGYQRGFSLAQLPDQANPNQRYAPDKTGKDDNFRGETVFKRWPADDVCRTFKNVFDAVEFAPMRIDTSSLGSAPRSCVRSSLTASPNQMPNGCGVAIGFVVDSATFSDKVLNPGRIMIGALERLPPFASAPAAPTWQRPHAVVELPFLEAGEGRSLAGHAETHDAWLKAKGAAGVVGPGRTQYGVTDIPAYWALAQQHTLCDHYFTDVASQSEPNHLFLIAANAPIIDNASHGRNDPPQPPFDMLSLPQTWFATSRTTSQSSSRNLSNDSVPAPRPMR